MRRRAKLAARQVNICMDSWLPRPSLGPWRPLTAKQFADDVGGWPVASVQRLRAAAQSRAACGEQQQSMNMTSAPALVNHGAVRRPCRR